jgi:hypothetical protein
MRVASVIAISLIALPLGAEEPGGAVVARIAAAEAKLPWMWSPSAEGIADIPYTYVTAMSRTIEGRAGKTIEPKAGGNSLANWRQVKLERIPLEWGSFLKCLKVDGQAPCPAEWMAELDRQTKAVAAMTAEDRARSDAVRAERRERRRAFWAEFPDAFRFERTGPEEIRFSPAPGFKVKNGPRDGMLTGIEGKLRYDPASFQLVSMDYGLVRDVADPFMKLPKGAHFEADLAKLADEHYAPMRLVTKRKLPGKGNETEVSVVEYSDYRKFDTNSNIQFEDKGK